MSCGGLARIALTDCRSLGAGPGGLPRIQGDMNITVNATSPDPAAANSLFTSLANRFMQAYGLLNCPNLISRRI